MGAERRGLLVDFGGVLTTSMMRSFASFSARVGLDRAVLRATFAEALTPPDGAILSVELGRLSGDEFGTELARVLHRASGIAFDPDELLDGLFAEVRPETRMLDAVAGARAAGVLTGLLSNSWGGRERYPYERFDELFDTVVISAEVGMRKPDPAIFRLAARRLGMPPAACLFVDDLRVNIEAAERVGMTGVLHSDPDATIARLVDLLELPASTRTPTS